MRAAILGGGPGGLNFAISLKLRDPSHDVVVIERNRPDDTFGWGVVLSDETLDNLAANDPGQRRQRSATLSSIGTTSRCTIAARRCAPAATASAASAASGCSTSCRSAPATLGVESEIRDRERRLRAPIATTT